MKLCTRCYRELFDNDKKCDICKCEKLITKDEIETIKAELLSANKFLRVKLTKNEKYNVVHQYLTHKHGEKYWRKIHYSEQLLYPLPEKIEPVITYPYCHSTNTKKISGTSKVAHVALFGIFALSRNSKNYDCNNCKSNF